MKKKNDLCPLLLQPRLHARRADLRARDDMVKAVTDAGYDYIMMDKELTRYGGVETRDEGLLYAKWLKEHEGQYDGVIFSMPISPTKRMRSPLCRTQVCLF